MPHRYVPTTPTPSLRLLPFAGLRAAFADGYGARELRSDVLAGLVVGVVALPLSMALAIAVGVPPQHGLYTAIVATSVPCRCNHQPAIAATGSATNGAGIRREIRGTSTSSASVPSPMPNSDTLAVPRASHSAWTRSAK